MSSQTITNTPPHESARRPDHLLPPSVMRDDDLLLPRASGMVGACAVVFSGLVLILMRFGIHNIWEPYLGTSGFIVLLVLGLAFMLFHAAFDRDLTYRRLYAVFGGALPLFTGFVVMVIPWPNAVGDLFMPGFLLLIVALLFGLAFQRVETDTDLKAMALFAVGGAGALLAFVGIIVAGIYSNMLIPYGLLLGLLGLVYLAGFSANRGGDDLGYYGGIAIGVFGAIALLLSLVRSFFPGWFHTQFTEAASFFIPRGVLLLTMGLAYLFVSVGLVSDSRLVVMTRRELGAYCFSPVVYLVLMAFIVVQWISFMLFVGEISIIGDSQASKPLPEPIVANYIRQWLPIIFCLILVPILTMRLISEEKRSGTLELLLTSPVDEIHVVLSKFIAGFLMFLLMWIPFFLFLIALRMGNNVDESKKDFDYMPLLGFALALIVTGANFISIGLFFSSLTKDQITSVVLTFAAMFALTMVILLRQIFFRNEMVPGPEKGTMVVSTWAVVLRHISYIDTWFDAMTGKVVLKYLIFPISSTIFFLFLSTKVLEARKWS